MLLIEDDAADAELVRRALARTTGRPFELDHYQTLAEGLERVDRGGVDLAILDLSLPDCSGAPTYERFRAAAPAVPVVVITGLEDTELANELLQGGAQDYLLKHELGERNVARCLEYALERTHFQRALETAHASALAANRTKSAFLSTMSHEIRTPLNAILGMAELLSATPLSTEQREYVEIFQRCGGSLMRLLDNVLELTRLEAGKLTVSEREFDLLALLEESVETFGFSAHRKRIGIALDCPPGVPRRVRGDPDRLRQVLFNLLGNAVKFTPRGHVVLRAASAGGERIRFEVSDTGMGIAPERIEAVFERFEQADTAVASTYGGSGLGLALAAQLVRLMGGEIGVRSTPGAGSTFHAELPLPPASNPAADPAPEDSGAMLADTNLLLIVDDGCEREILARTLRESGAAVDEQSSVVGAQAALEAAAGDGRRFDALVFDCRMPDAGGLDVARWLRDARAPLSPRVIALLPMDHRVGDHALCQQLGAIPLLKPPRRELLLRALRTGTSPGEIAEAARPRRRAGDLALRGLRLLLVEDSPDNRTLALAYLRPTGCQVDVAENGLRALELWRMRRYDLILMDVHMPELDGCEATRRIRAAELASKLPHTPIVALTAYALPEERERCLEAGCDEHLTKPISRDRLLRVVGSMVDAPASPQGPEPAIAVPPELADLAEEYVGNRRRDCGALREAVAAGDGRRVRALGHNMKGSGAGYGFPRVSEIGAALERAGQRGDMEETGRWIEALERHLDTAEQQLRGEAKDPGDAAPDARF